MKRFTIAMLALLVASGPALAAVSYVWSDGDGTKVWGTQGNWDQNFHYPGFGSGDDATIDMSFTISSDFPVSLQSGLSNHLASLTMRDGTSSTPVSLDVGSGVTLTVDGAFQVVQYQDAESYVEKDDTGTITAGSFVITASTNNPATVVVAGGLIQTN